jgi:hypothetical protein
MRGDTEKKKIKFPLNLYREIQRLCCVVYRRCITRTLVSLVDFPANSQGISK